MVLYPNIFMEVNIAILTVTDTRTIDNDKSGAILVKKVEEQKHKLVDRKIVKDKKEDIKKIISDEVILLIFAFGKSVIFYLFYFCLYTIRCQAGHEIFH